MDDALHSAQALVAQGRQRAVITQIEPQVDGGRYPIKRVIGDSVTVRVEAIADGHDLVSCALLFRPAGQGGWFRTRMQSCGMDRFEGRFTVTQQGRYEYTVEAWADHFATWRRDLTRRRDAGQELDLPLREGAALIRAGVDRARPDDRDRLASWAALLEQPTDETERYFIAQDDELGALAARYPDPALICRYPELLPIVVDRLRARYSTWYELFPRSCAREPGRHGRFQDCLERLHYLAYLGCDVLYLPPIHPIGRTDRKGRNNALAAQPDDVGSPWAIGADEGGHTAIHPALGTLEDFQRLVNTARAYGIEIALDMALQCAPDHPWVREHPHWFRHRADGSIAYAENPPKKYQDIYPIHFESQDWRALWNELLQTFLYWVEQGVRIFRVDNPHTKPLRFWEWLIQSVKERHPDVLFLSEAFTRPAVMHQLAKLGFTQSYTYFTWRNDKWGLTQYLTELTQSAGREYLRPNLWPNTPDILHEFLQQGGRPVFAIRLVLAATLGANYGIYGPAFELQEHRPREPGSEEYLDSEKYQIRYWDLNAPHSLKELIATVNRIRRDNPALQSDFSLRFHPVDNDYLIAYSKHTDDLANVLLTIVNLDPDHVQTGFVELPLADFGIDSEQPYPVVDLLTGASYTWRGVRNWISLDPAALPAHVLCIRRHTRTEQDFEYYF